MADRSPGDFGRKLRAARERRGISLREIANATKIGMSALEALERNDFSRLPGGIFSRAFVRAYAIEVGLDPEETIREFIDEFPHDVIAAGHPARPQAEDHDAIESERQTATTFVRLIALSVPIAAALLYFGMAGRGSERREPAPAAVEQAAPAADEALPASPAPTAGSRVDVPGSNAPVPAPPEPPASPAGPGSAIPAAPAVATAGSTPGALPADTGGAGGPLTVSLSAIRPCWVSIAVDGVTSARRLMQPGDKQTIDVRRDLVLTAGDAAALAMTLNGIEAKPLGKTGQVVTVRISASNFKAYVIGQ